MKVTAVFVAAVLGAVAAKDDSEVRRFEVREARAELRKQLGRLDPEELAAAISRAREHSARLVDFPRAQADPKRPLRQPVEISFAEASATILSTQPVPRTFGSTGQWVEVTAKNPIGSASLRFRLGEEMVRHLETGTIVVARWDPLARRFSLIPQSGFNPDFGYAFARISRPGLYTAIGLPKDPRIQTTLATIGAMRQTMLLGETDFTPRICGLILCSPDFGGPGPPGPGNVCDMCLGGSSFPGGLGRIPENDLFGILCQSSVIGCYAPFFPKPCPRWVNMGPANIPGRIRALVANPLDGKVLYAGSAAGGVFKTVTSGTDWAALWENQLSLAIGGLAVAPSNVDVLYAATGEWDVSVSAIYTMYPGYGVYRSADGGSSWKRLAPITSLETAAVAIDPTSADRVFVAGAKSLHRSSNGGATWDVTPGNTNGIFDGEISDVVIDPNNANRLFIGVHHSAVRTGGIYRSTNGGNTWSLLSTGIPTGVAADGPKIALGRSGTHGTDFVAVKMSDQVFTSIDGGNSFTQKTNPGFLAGQGRYMNVIAVDPTNESIIFGGDMNLFRSDNGGTTWTNVSNVGISRFTRIHEDLHALVFDPADHNKVFVATDNGIYKSLDNGKTWEAIHGAGGIPADPFINSNLVTLQCWTVSVSQEPARFALAVTSHDNYSYSLQSGKTFAHLNYLGRGEGGWVEYDPKNADIIYSDNWYSEMRKTTNGTAWWQNQVWSNLGVETSNLNAKPLSIAWNNTNLLLTIERATGNVWRSTNGGTSWSTVLTVPGEEFTAVAYAPSDDNHAYAATMTGRVWHSTNAGVTWTELNRVGLPNNRVHDIDVDWSDPLRVYVAFGTRGALAGVGFRQLWRGTVGTGTVATWVDISGATPAVSLPDLGLTGLVLDPSLEDTIYVSNIIGVYRSTDGGDSWVPFDEGLPNTFVSDLEIRKWDRTLYVSTMGRGVYRRAL